MILIPESEFSISWVLLFNTVARAYYYTLPLSTHPPFFAFLLKKILLLLSKSIKKKSIFSKKTKGSFICPCWRTISFVAFIKGLFILLPLSKGPFFYCPHLWSWSHSQWLAERRICLAVWVSLSPLLPLLSPHQTFIKVKWCIQFYKHMDSMNRFGIKQENYLIWDFLNLTWLWFLYPFWNTWGWC